MISIFKAMLSTLQPQPSKTWFEQKKTSLNKTPWPFYFRFFKQLLSALGPRLNEATWYLHLTVAEWSQSIHCTIKITLIPSVLFEISFRQTFRSLMLTHTFVFVSIAHANQVLGKEWALPSQIKMSFKPPNSSFRRSLIIWPVFYKRPNWQKTWQTENCQIIGGSLFPPGEPSPSAIQIPFSWWETSEASGKDRIGPNCGSSTACNIETVSQGAETSRGISALQATTSQQGQWPWASF